MNGAYLVQGYDLMGLLKLEHETNSPIIRSPRITEEAITILFGSYLADNFTFLKFCPDANDFHLILSFQFPRISFAWR